MKNIFPYDTLQEATIYFSHKENCIEFLKQIRWADGVFCPHCESKRISEVPSRSLWQCKECRKQFSIKVGTVFEHSPIPLSKWLVILFAIANAKNGISSCEIARAFKVRMNTPQELTPGQKFEELIRKLVTAPPPKKKPKKKKPKKKS